MIASSSLERLKQGTKMKHEEILIEKGKFIQGKKALKQLEKEQSSLEGCTFNPSLSSSNSYSFLSSRLDKAK